MLPLAWFFVQNPDLLFLRPSQIAVDGTRRMDNWCHAISWHNLRASVLMFVPFGELGRHEPRRNLPGEAALAWWQFRAVCDRRLALALWRLRNPAYSILLIGLVGMLLPGVLSEHAPHFHRVLGAAAPVALLCGFGLDGLIDWAVPTQAWSCRCGRTGVSWLSVVLIVGGAVTTARDYFVRWASLPDLFYAFDVGLVGGRAGHCTPAGGTHRLSDPAQHGSLRHLPLPGDAARQPCAAGQL